MQDYRKLRVWEKAFALALAVRQAADGFPRSGYAELRAQMVSAAESVVFNIVEGCGAGSQKEFGRFLEIAIKSTMELEAELELARAYDILASTVWHRTSEETIDTRRMLFGLRKKVLGTAEPTLSPLPNANTNAKRKDPNASAKRKDPNANAKRKDANANAKRKNANTKRKNTKPKTQTLRLRQGPEPPSTPSSNSPPKPTEN